MPGTKKAADSRQKNGAKSPQKGKDSKARAEARKGKAVSGRASRQKKAASTGRPVLDELLALLPELDESGLAFLLEQAKVHRYNMEVDRLNAITERAAAGDNSTHAPTAGAGDAKTIRIERSADGSTYHLVAGSDWKMFTAEEMAALVRITRSGEGPEETARRIRAWLARERKDVYLDLGLDGPSIGMARDIAELVARTFPKRC